MSAPTKTSMKSPCLFSAVCYLVSVVSPLRSGVCRPAQRGINLSLATRLAWSVVCLLAASTMAGDLAVDNITVSSNATIYGTVNINSVSTDVITNAAVATGGSITTNGNYIIHTFTNLGATSFVVSGGTLSCDVLVVAGGGGGGSYSGGGGGGGGVIYTNVSVSDSKSIVVGDGGIGSYVLWDGTNWWWLPLSSNGFDSSFGTITALGGGAGGTRIDTPGNGTAGKTGGSGGGGSICAGGNAGGSGAVGQGHDGGTVTSVTDPYGSAGGGGAGSDGSDSSGVGGAGGIGYDSAVSGTSYKYGAGGGGGVHWNNDVGGAGGADGGGKGGYGIAKGVDGAANSGGGGGGGGAPYVDTTQRGGNGGSGIVIVRYTMTTSSNVTMLSISSNGISQTSASAANVFMGKVGIGINNPAEKLHVVGNARVDGTITLGGETRTNWPNVAVGALIASSNLSDVADPAAARDNLGLGSAATYDASAFISTNGDGSQITGITAAQVGALSTNAGALIAANNLSDVADIATARDNLGALSTTGGVVNGSLDVTGSIAAGAPAGDIPMGVYTNR